AGICSGPTSALARLQKRRRGWPVSPFPSVHFIGNATPLPYRRPRMPNLLFLLRILVHTEGITEWLKTIRTLLGRPAKRSRIPSRAWRRNRSMKRWRWHVASCRAKAVFATLLRAGLRESSHTFRAPVTSNELLRWSAVALGKQVLHLY